MSFPSLRGLVAAVTVTAGVAALSTTAADAAPSCTRDGAAIEAASKSIRIVRQTLPRTGNQTRRQRLLACSTKTGRRFTIATEVDQGEDNRARTAVEIVDDRYVGVVAVNEGGVSLSQVARVYDGRTRALLHDSSACEAVDQVDFNGASDVVFLRGGGMAMACRQLVLFKTATSEAEVLEPAGTFVTQLAKSQYSEGFGQRLFWTVLPQGATEPTTKSLAL